MDADNVEVQGLDDVEVEVQELEEDRGKGLDDFMEDNNIIFEDYDHDTEAFMRQYNFGEDYEPMEEAELDSEPHEAYTETERGACYLDEDQMLDDLGPELDDIGPIPEYSYEHSDQLFELSGEEDDGEEEVDCLPSTQKNTKGGLEYCLEVHLRNPVLFLCLDGCFLKGVFKGQILAIVGLDADNRIYPIAWVVIEVENTDS
ncbi:hypothetical protein LIER_41761 [Lithospermum erythrorhizon]|uniref:Uncharacterized protein n=1 Tax=Lithospermum erythrorhizon TaxID=34254 RepID=A0AAV3RE23_LITER